MRTMFLGLAAAAAAGLVLKKEPSPTQMNIKCLLAHCGKEVAAAALNPKFMEMSKCELGCNKIYDDDMTVGKLHYQNCTTKCALTYETKAGDNFLTCAMNNDCVHFAPLNVTCPVDLLTANLDPAASLQSLEGEWWQHYGKNALWDCYPCQHIHAMSLVNDSAWCAKTVTPHGPVAAPCWSYSYSYDVFVEDGTQYYGQVWQLPSSKTTGHPIDIYYNYMGSTHNETWYILKAAANYVVLVDCSYMQGWTNVGSILWVRPNHTLTDAEMADISAVYAKVGWSFPAEFCVDRHGDTAHCDSGAPQAEVSGGRA